MTAIKKSRAANMDLLRIVSMLLIVFLHSVNHSGVLENAAASGVGIYTWVKFVHMLCMVCVNLFVMLSGYFMVGSEFKLHKLLSLWIQTAFYAVFFRLLFIACGLENFSIASLISCFFPFLTGRYWFLTIYVGLYLLSPFLNALVRAMDKRKHALLNLVLFLLMSAWSSVHPAFAGMNSGGGWGLAWFVVLYLVAAWFRLYYTPRHKSSPLLLAFIAIPLAIGLLLGVCQAISLPAIISTVLHTQIKYNSAPAYLMTVFLFVAFLNVKIASEKVSRFICAVAPLTLGVYLIHDHANVDPWLWQTINLPAYMHNFLFIPIQLGVVLGIFIVCILLDTVRKYTVGRLEKSRIVYRVGETLTQKAKRILSKILPY